MILYSSDIFENFKCIGSRCKDNCCKMGWDIEIDSKTLEFYSKLPPPVNRLFLSNIYEDDGDYYICQKDGCPFLNKDGLCSLQLKYGEQNISEICREHPRFYQWFGNYKEAGVGLCCEEACRLILEHPKPILFTEKEIDEQKDDLPFKEDLLKSVMKIREKLISIMQNRGFNVRERITILLYISDDIQQAICSENCKRLNQISSMLAIDGFLIEIVNESYEDIPKKDFTLHEFTKLLKIFNSMDFMNRFLQDKLVYISNNLEKILSCEKSFDNAYDDRSFELEHIGVYILFRYFIQSVRDLDGKSKIYLAIIWIIVIKLLFLAEFYKKHYLPTQQESVELLKEFSKEVEYSLENMASIQDNIDMDEINFTSLKALILGRR